MPYATLVWLTECEPESCWLKSASGEIQLGALNLSEYIRSMHEWPKKCPNGTPAAGLRAATAAGAAAAGASIRPRVCPPTDRVRALRPRRREGPGRVRPLSFPSAPALLHPPAGPPDTGPAPEHRGAASELERKGGAAGLAGAGPQGTLPLLLLLLLLPWHRGGETNGPMAVHRTACESTGSAREPRSAPRYPRVVGRTADEGITAANPSGPLSPAPCKPSSCDPPSWGAARPGPGMAGK